MTELRAFCNQLVAFFEDISETYPEEADIRTAAQALKLVKQANPRFIYTTFMHKVYSEFAEHILNENEEYILDRAKKILESEHSEINYAFWIFDKHWSTMSETNKQHIWRYIKTLVLLARRVPGASPPSVQARR
jgi:hypothetical protein